MPKFLKCEFSSFVKFLLTLILSAALLQLFHPDRFIMNIVLGTLVALYVVVFIVRFLRMLTMENYSDYPCEKPDWSQLFFWWN